MPATKPTTGGAAGGLVGEKGGGGEAVDVEEGEGGNGLEEQCCDRWPLIKCHERDEATDNC